MKGQAAIRFFSVVTLLLLGLPTGSVAQVGQDSQYLVELKSREFIPTPGVEPALAHELEAAGEARWHALVQFEEIPNEAQLAALENSGVRLLAYVPNYAWFASLPATMSPQDPVLARVRWMGAIQAADRTAPILGEAAIRRELADDRGQIDLDVRFFSDIEAGEAIRLLTAYGAVIREKVVDFNRYEVALAAGVLDALAQEDAVQWIAPALPPKTMDNDGIRARTNVNVVHASPYDLSGSGVDLGVWDGGVADGHIDFGGRLTVVDSAASVGNHATHVAGTMAGDGSNSANQGGSALQWKGMAPGADILSYYWDNNLVDHNGAINTYGIELSQNSWSYSVDEAAYGNCWIYGNYDYGAPDYDDIITGLYGRRIMVVFSASNERNDGDCGMSSTPPYLNYANIPPPPTAKNILAVGATNSDDDSMTTFSSWGPLDDGRLKPDIVAPGCENGASIRSTFPGNTYGNMCGTSMAAPAVSGMSGLIIEQYRASIGGDPLPSTVKALLVQTAMDMDDGSIYHNPGPDYASGYGRVDVQAAVDAIIAGKVREDQVSHGQIDSFTLDVPPGASSLKVTLAWDDEPGAVNASPALVNNLNLILVEPNGTTTHLPWVLNPASPSSFATTGTDSINNVEQVEVNSPTAGAWQVRVVGSNVPVGPQWYSLAGGAFGGSGPGDVGPLFYDGHTVDDDNTNNSIGNGDGVVNPGETIELYVDLYNDGADPATDVYATLSTSDPYVTFLYNTSSEYGSVTGGGVGTNVNDFDFEISASAPNGHVVHFDLDITASNGGPWSDSFDLTVVGGGGGGNVALISDQTELAAISGILDSMGLTYDVINGNWDGAQGIYTSDYAFLSSYGMVVWYASGATDGRLITQQEHDALEQYLQAGGRLLVTGYDTLGSPTDLLLADLVRSIGSGDGPFTNDYTITNGDHPITNGPFGTFPAGTALLAAHSDHDQAEADAGRGALTVAELAGGADKLLATELASGGIVVYWNGNRDVSDWTGILPAAVESGGPADRKRAADGAPIGTLTLEDLQGRARRIAPTDVPAEANYEGSDPVWIVPREALSEARAEPSPQDSQSVTFPASGDTVSVVSNPYWWHAGDYAEGTRSISMSSVNRVDYDWSTTHNSLSGSGQVDLALFINGIALGGFTVNPGEYAKSVSFAFAPISGPPYVIRLEETNTVDPGQGAIQIPLDLSTMTFFAPSTAQQVNMLKNTLYWLNHGVGAGDPHEPNDTPERCTPIFFDVAITDPTVDPAGDLNYYCFSGSAGQTIAADIDANLVGSPLDSVLTLFDSDGITVLAQNDDYGSLDSYLEYTLPHDGTFYLRVRSYAHPCCGGPDYSYSIRLTDLTQPRSLPFFDDVEAGTNGWGADGLWHQVQDGVSPYPNSFSPTHSWWYGQDATGDYNTGAANTGNLTSPPIDILPGVPAELSFWQWYETEPVLMPQSVYFDVYHDSDGDGISGGAYTDWATWLVDYGFTVVEYDQPIDLGTLSGHQVLALFDPEVALTAAEISAINSFLLAGGRAVLLGEWGDASGTNTILNALSSSHGITFNSDMVSDPTNHDGEDFWPLIYNFADDPLVQGLGTVVLYAGCSLSLGGLAEPLATGDGDTTATVELARTEEGMDDVWVDIKGLAAPEDLVPGAPVVMARTAVGNGELIAVGDSNLWTNDDPDGDGVTALDEYDGRWLARRFFGDEVDHPSWDQKWVQISVDGGPFQNLVQITGGPVRAWHQTAVDLAPYAGSTVRLRFHFDTIDSAANGYRGWYVDDVLVDTEAVGPMAYHDHIIDDDNVDQSAGNGDGVADAGETIELYVALGNDGTDTATNVQACVTEDSPYVGGFLFNSCATYGDMGGGGTALNGDDFDFTINPAAPSGHSIQFDLTVTADNGGPWATSFDVVVGQGATVGPLLYVNATVDDDILGESVGNGDGQINPGEIVELTVEVGNAGTATAASVVGEISETSSYVSGFLYNVSSSFGDISGGGTGTNSDDFDFAVDINAPDGHIIPFCLDLSAANGGPWTVCFELPVVQIAAGATLRLVPSDQEVPLTGGTFGVDLKVEDISHLGAFQFDLAYDPAIVHVEGTVLGPFLGTSGCSVSELPPIIDNVSGRTTYGGFIMGSCSGPSGSGVLATVILRPMDVGVSALVVENEQLMNSDDPPTAIAPVDLYHGQVTVTDCFFADVDCDGDVDISDIYNVAYRWGCGCGDVCYVPRYDFNDDCAISVSDIQIVACYFGWPGGDYSGCWAPSGGSVDPLPERSTTLLILPDSQRVAPGESFSVALQVEEVQDLAGFEAVLEYDPRVLRFDGVGLGDFLASTGNKAELREPVVDESTGTVALGAFSYGAEASAEGAGMLVTLAFTAVGSGESSLTLSAVEMARHCGLAQPAPKVVSGIVRSGWSLYLPLVQR